MGYATNSDVAAEFPTLVGQGGFTTTTKVTAAQVDEWCTRYSAYIDSKIGGKYLVPVTAPTASLELLKEICCLLVFAKVAPLLGVSTGDAKTSTGANGKKLEPKAQADSMLTDIASGTMILNGSALATSADGAEGYTSDNAATISPPTMKRDKRQW